MTFFSLRISRARGAIVASAAAVVVAFALTGCTHAPKPEHTSHPKATISARGLSAPSATPTPTVAPSATADPTAPALQPTATAATATVASVPVSPSPGAGATTRFANPQSTGAPLVFLVLASQKGWLQVQLPARPNGSSGWIPAGDVTQSTMVYHLLADTETNTLVLFKDGVAQRTFTVATGTGGTPTPHGSFYLTELLAPTNSGYGPYAYGLSAFSNVLTSFGGGPGQIGLHGTNEASSIGKDASHGCIRMNNSDITTLAKLLPLGTPITIY